MEIKKASVIGAAAVIATGAAVGTVSPALAEPVPAAASYADLLQPVPNAAERLNAADAVQGGAQDLLLKAQYNPNGAVNHHHHHHHHHQYSRRWYMQHGYRWNGRSWVLRPRHHHHHHHHHHHDNG